MRYESGTVVAEGDFVARIPIARFEIIEGSGHLVPIDEPEKLARRIAAFASSLK